MKVSFQQQLNDQEVLIERLKLKCLYGEFEEKKKLLQSKKSNTEKLITQLSQLAVQSQAVPAVKAASDKLNQFSAELFAGLDELQMKHEEKRIAIEQNKTMNIDLDFDMRMFEGFGSLRV